MKYWVLIIVAFAALSGCEKDNFDRDKHLHISRELIAELDSKSVDTLKIGSEKYVLDAKLWNDAMSAEPAGVSRLFAVNRLIGIDSVDIPGNLELIEQYVILSDSVWVAEYKEEIYITPTHMLKRISENGPDWGPDVQVDVISKIHDSTTKRDYFLRKGRIVIKGKIVR
jgi:hypothetical protein